MAVNGLINFCLEPFVQSVEASSVQADGYHVSNLISTNVQEHIKGFQVEPFIRPPVTIEISFIVPVHVGCIVLEPQLMGNDEVKIEVSGGWMRSHIRHIGSATFRTGGGVVHVLWNRDFERSHGKLRSDMQVLGSYLNRTLSVDGPTDYALKHSKSLSNLLCLQVCVRRVSGAKPVAIKLLEVWGRPSPTCTSDHHLAFERALGGLQMDQPCLSPPSQFGVYRSYQEHGNRPQSGHIGACSGCESTDSAKIEVHSGKPTSRCSGLGSCTPSPSASTCKPHEECRREYCFSRCLGNKIVPSSSQMGVPHACAEKGQSTLESSAAVFPRTSTERQTEGAQVCHFNHGRMEETGARDPLQTASGRKTSEVQQPDWSSLSGNPAKVSVDPSKSPRPADENSVIPERFLDEITCELMVLPMLLPSGHYVDRSTLDRLTHMNALYGRGDCDPFTGVLFSENTQPQFCAELKTEIDKVSLSEGSLVDPCLGRTLGTASDILQHINQHTKGVKRGREGEGRSGVDNGGVKRPRHGQDVPAQASGTSLSQTSQSAIHGQETVDKATTSVRLERKWEPAHETAVAESLDKALKELYSL